MAGTTNANAGQAAVFNEVTRDPIAVVVHQLQVLCSESESAFHATCIRRTTDAYLDGSIASHAQPKHSCEEDDDPVHPEDGVVATHLHQKPACQKQLTTTQSRRC